MASGFSPPSDEHSRSTRGSDSSNPGANVRDLVPAVSVVRTRTQSRPRTQPQAAGSDGNSTPSPSPQPAPSLSSQQATFLAGAAIQTVHQASHMASSAASSALQGHQAAVFARARERLGSGRQRNKHIRLWVIYVQRRIRWLIMSDPRLELLAIRL